MSPRVAPRVVPMPRMAGEPATTTLGEFRSKWSAPRPWDEDAVREATWRYLTTSDLQGLTRVEWRALSKATGPAGAFLVPTSLVGAGARGRGA